MYDTGFSRTHIALATGFVATLVAGYYAYTTYACQEKAEGDGTPGAPASGDDLAPAASGGTAAPDATAADE